MAKDSFFTPDLPPSSFEDYDPAIGRHYQGHSQTSGLMGIMDMLTAVFGVLRNPQPYGDKSKVGLVELLNTTVEKRLYVEIVGTIADLIRGANSFAHWDQLTINKAADFNDALTTNTLTYTPAGQLVQVWFIPGEGYGPPVQVIPSAIRFKGPNGELREYGGAKAGDYPYLADISGLVIPDLSITDTLFLVYLPRIANVAPPVESGMYQPPLKTDSFIVPAGYNNKLLIPFVEFSTTAPEVHFFYTADQGELALTEVPIGNIQYEPVIEGIGDSATVTGIKVWTAITEDVMSVFAKIKP